MKTFRLSNSDINSAVDKTRAFLQGRSIRPSTVLCMELAFEETLLVFRDALGSDAAFRVKCFRKGDTLRIVLRVQGERTDPFTSASDILPVLADKLPCPPAYSFHSGVNTVSFSIPSFSSIRQNLAFTWGYARAYRLPFFGAVGAQLLSVALQIAAPLLIARIIVQIAQSLFTQIMLTALMLMAVRMFKNLLVFAANRGYNHVYNKMLTSIETDLVKSVLDIKNASIDERGTGLFMQRLTMDTTRLATGFNTFADLISQMINYIGILAAILIVSPVMFGYTAAVMAVLIFIELKRSERLNEDDRSYRTANEGFSGFVSEMIRGSTDVKLLNCGMTFIREIQRRIENTNESRMAMQGRAWSFRLTRQELGEVGDLGFVALLLGFMLSGGMTPALALVLFNYNAGLGSPSILILGQFLEFLKDFMLSCERVSELIGSPDFPKEEYGDVQRDDLKGTLTFRDVSFAYPCGETLTAKGPQILKNISFEIEDGEKVAFVGKSGSGKTTVFNLISRLFDPDAGEIRIDGVPIQSLSRESLRNHLTVVSQKPYIFNLTIRDNLRLVREMASDEEIREACALAWIDEDIRKMPDGYDTLIGEGGVNLSGGQRQRLAIARSMLKGGKLILLDEATSALDNTTQAGVLDEIMRKDNSCTVILIAHRLSTVIGMDRIFFLKDGAVCASGTHKELMDTCAEYRELYLAESRVTG